MISATIADIKRYVGKTQYDKKYPYVVTQDCRDIAALIAVINEDPKSSFRLSEVIAEPLSGLSDDNLDEIQFDLVLRRKYYAARSVAGLIQQDALRDKALNEIPLVKRQRRKSLRRLLLTIPR